MIDAPILAPHASPPPRRGAAVPAGGHRGRRQDLRFFLTAYAWGLAGFVLVFG